MERVRIDSLEATTLPAATRRNLAAALEATDVALQHYQIPPGGSLPGGLHAHADQAELFVVLEGTATFETIDGVVSVEAGEAIRFGPGTFQSGLNEDDRPLTLLALGAPPNSTDVRLPTACPDCGFEPIRLETDEGARFSCPDCAAVFRPEPCPSCDHPVLEFTLEGVSPDVHPVVECGGCGVTYERPPLTPRRASRQSKGSADDDA